MADTLVAPFREKKPEQWRKTCFVTIGATASFSSMIRACTTAEFQEALIKHEYTELVVQFGADGGALFAEGLSLATAALKEKGISSVAGVLSITGFPVDTSGLEVHFRRCKGKAVDKVREGVVLSHAGSGTILGAMRMGLPVVVVPNEELLDNHQVQLAEALAKQGYVVHGHLHDLPQSLTEAEGLRERLNGWPPVNSGERIEHKGSIQRVLDEEAGYLD